MFGINMLYQHINISVYNEEAEYKMCNKEIVLMGYINLYGLIKQSIYS